MSSKAKAEWKWPRVELSALKKVAAELRQACRSPAVIILTGPVGAGKTALTKSFVGAAAEVNSPTYSLINEVGNILHADLYRIDQRNDLIHLEINLYAEGKDYLFFEWGGPYQEDLYRLLEGDYHFYEIEIEINSDGDEGKLPTRNFFLRELSF